MELLTMFAIIIATQVIAYVLMPKPKKAKPAAAKDFEAPTAEAGRPVPVPFGTITIRSPNVLDYADISTRQFKVKPPE